MYVRMYICTYVHTYIRTHVCTWKRKCSPATWTFAENRLLHERVGRGAHGKAAVVLVSELDLSTGETGTLIGAQGCSLRGCARFHACPEPPETIPAFPRFPEVDLRLGCVSKEERCT